MRHFSHKLVSGQMVCRDGSTVHSGIWTDHSKIWMTKLSSLVLRGSLEAKTHRSRDRV